MPHTLQSGLESGQEARIAQIDFSNCTIRAFSITIKTFSISFKLYKLYNKLIGYGDNAALMAVLTSPVVRISVVVSLIRDLGMVSEWCDL